MNEEMSFGEEGKAYFNNNNFNELKLNNIGKNYFYKV